MKRRAIFQETIGAISADIRCSDSGLIFGFFFIYLRRGRGAGILIPTGAAKPRCFFMLWFMGFLNHNHLQVMFFAALAADLFAAFVLPT